MGTGREEENLKLAQRCTGLDRTKLWFSYSDLLFSIRCLSLKLHCIWKNKWLLEQCTFSLIPPEWLIPVISIAESQRIDPIFFSQHGLMAQFCSLCLCILHIFHPTPNTYNGPDSWKTQCLGSSACKHLWNVQNTVLTYPTLQKLDAFAWYFVGYSAVICCRTAWELRNVSWCWESAGKKAGAFDLTNSPDPERFPNTCLQTCSPVPFLAH